MTRGAAFLGLIALATGSAEGNAPAKLQVVAGGFSQPLFLTHAGDGSGRLFIVEQAGRIRILKERELLPTAFLDIQHKVTSGGERGLLGLAFHPDFAENRRFFVNYTRTANGQLRTTVAEYTASASNPDQAGPTETILLEFNQPFDNHNGGMLAFGPDGFLYIGTGDGGSGGDPLGNGQNKGTLLGKILRIDIDSGDPYAIPLDNPFLGQPGIRAEIWAFGLRNPWRFSFDRTSRRLFAADVGQSSWEEIDLIEKGGNYGWNIMEGNHCFPPGTTSCEKSSLKAPIAEYNHFEGASVTGGYVYQGQQDSPLRGSYFFGDFVSGRVWTLTEKPEGTWERAELLQTGLSISSFGEDENGELYVLDHAAGAVYQLHLGPPLSSQQEKLFFAQFGNGVSVTSDLILTNPSTDDGVSGEVAFFDANGDPLPIGIAGAGSEGSVPLTAEVSPSDTTNSVSFTLPPLGVRTIATDGQGILAVGSAVVSSDKILGGIVRLNLRGIGIAGVGASQPLEAFLVPVRRQVGGINTGIALHNTESQDVTLDLTLRNKDGEQIPNGTRTIADFTAHGHLAQFISELFPQADTDNFEGVLLLETTGGKVAATAMELDSDTRQFTTLPVTPVE